MDDLMNEVNILKTQVLVLAMTLDDLLHNVHDVEKGVTIKAMERAVEVVTKEKVSRPDYADTANHFLYEGKIGGEDK